MRYVISQCVEEIIVLSAIYKGLAIKKIKETKPLSEKYEIIMYDLFIRVVLELNKHENMNKQWPIKRHIYTTDARTKKTWNRGTAIELSVKSYWGA